MDHKKIAKYAAIFATMFALLAAIPTYAPDHQAPPFPMIFAKAYVAQVNATGTLNLKNFTGVDSFSLDINTTFTSLVPSIIETGEYDAEFHGFATTPGEHVRLDGMMVINSDNFWVAFAVDRPSDISTGRYSANGPLHLNISEFTLPPQQVTMVSMKGNVTKFGDKDTFGFLEANAKTGTRNFTNVHTSFTLQLPPRRGEDDEKGPNNFTVSFYIVTLANATKTEMNYDGSALFVEGYWNVYNKTLTVTHFDDEETTTVVNIHTLFQNSSGTFNVTLTPQTSTALEEEGRAAWEEGKWRTKGNFTLDIPNLKDKIKGDVIFYFAKFGNPGDRDIPRCDFNQDHIVNIVDLSHVAHAFGAKYGDSRYESDLDLDCKLVINIVDIARAAAEFGQEY
jgi:hypothetical protein